MSVSNLQWEITQVRGKLGIPYRTDPQDAYITDEEIVNWLHEGEKRLALDVADDALPELQVEQSVNTVVDTGSYALPTDQTRILQVLLDSADRGLYECSLVNPQKFREIDTNPLWAATPRRPFVMFWNNKAYVRPIPTVLVTGGLLYRYVKVPTRRHRHYKGQTTAAGTNVTLVDTATPGPDDYWNASGVILRSGPLKGEVETVSDFVDSTGTLTVSSAFPAIPGSAVQFEVGQVSDISSEFIDMVILWATYLGRKKEQEEELAQTVKADYESELERINGRYQAFHRTEPSREVAR